MTIAGKMLSLLLLKNSPILLQIIPLLVLVLLVVVVLGGTAGGGGLMMELQLEMAVRTRKMVVLLFLGVVVTLRRFLSIEEISMMMLSKH